LQRRTPRSSRIAASISRTRARTVGGCHTRRHWNSPSYRTAAGNLSNCWRPKTQTARQRIHVRSGAEGARTPDLCNANAALSQLSYSPALARTRGEQISVSSTSQTETAPQSSGAAVTAINLAGRPALSSRRAAGAQVTAGRSRAGTRRRAASFSPCDASDRIALCARPDLAARDLPEREATAARGRVRAVLDADHSAAGRQLGADCRPTCTTA
jgi:hypothetical protein